MSNKNDIYLKINLLPTNLLPEVINYLDFLLSKYGQTPPTQPPTFNWEGGLSELKSKYDSVSLQKKLLEWR